MKVAIIGTTGYGGIELLRILNNLRSFKFNRSDSTKGDTPIWKEYPHLYNINDQIFRRNNSQKIAENTAMVFFATPSGVSSQLAAQFADLNLKVIDLSGDLRLQNLEDYIKWYKHEPAPEQLINKAVYGLTEWNRDKIANAEWISNPGCYSTASLLGLAPVIIEKLVVPTSIIIDAKSGTSGAGRKPSRMNMHAKCQKTLKFIK